jgi:hypothetical protein
VKSLFSLILIFSFFISHAQDDSVYIKTNAVRIENPESLSDSVYVLLKPFSIIMFGEMHGTNESAPFVNGLSELFTSKGDSVLVGLEIPPAGMQKFNSDRTDSSIYQSDFFRNPSYESGKESLPWAALISRLNKNRKVTIFFFDVNEKEGKPDQRDSLMSAKIKTQLKKYPGRRMITLTGNYHNKISDGSTITSYLKRDNELNVSSKICSLNLEYYSGTCRANFGKGLEVKRLGHYKTAYDSSVDFDKYLLLVSPKSDYEYNGFYYTRRISAAKMVHSQ